MKRMLALITGMVTVVSLLGGCSSNLSDKNNSSQSDGMSSSQASEKPPASAAPTGEELRTGLAIIGSLSSSKDAGGEDGLAEIDSNVVAVLVDADGRIVDCKIDAVQAQIPFSGEGKLLIDPASAVQSKQELGDAYGMRKASGIGREWNEQADALASYVIGKTADEVRKIALTETTAPADAELAATVTIKIGGWIDAIEKAVANAQLLGAQPGDKLGLGIQTSISGSRDADGEDGLAQASSTYAAASFGTDGRITSCILDGLQGKVNFDAAGQLTSDTGANLQTKNELKEAYGMKEASGIGKEWYEQAAAYAAYARGKTADELSGIAVNENGAPADAELSASVTISIGDFNLCLGKAQDSAW